MRGTPSVFYKSLNHRFNINGVDKDLFILNVGLSGVIALSAKFSLVMSIIAVLVMMIGHGAGVLITRADPIMKNIFLRHIHFKKYYPPISGIHAKSKLPKLSVPIYQTNNGKAV